MDNWYQHSFRRNLVDMHITDWDEPFLSQFDAEAYIDTVASCKDALMPYLINHLGAILARRD